MSLNPHFSAVDVSSPCAKLSFHINAFNGNTTNFCARPKLSIPIQPQQEVPSFSRKPSPGSMMPM